MHRFFVPTDQISEDSITISGSDVNHIVNVLRMKIGDEIEVFDSSGNTYITSITESQHPSIIKGKIIKKLTSDTEPEIKVTLAQCLPKGKKMDFIIQKATELGVNSIIPIISERSIPKIEDKAEKKVSRWQAIAKEAAEQCGRMKIPEIKQLLKFEALIKTAKDYSLALIPWEGEMNITLKSLLLPPILRILVLIGPEGGFSYNEVEQAKKEGFVPVSLGKRILRCETAGIVVLAQIFYELGV